MVLVSERLRNILYYGGLLGCVAWVLLGAWFTDSRSGEILQHFAAHDEFGNLKPGQPQYCPGTQADGYLWVRYAQDVAHTGHLRLRWTDFDNAPYGRPIAWSSGFACWLALLGEVESVLTGHPIDRAIEHMAMWGNPLILAAAIVGFAWVVRRRYGELAAFFCAFAMAGCSLFNEGFAADNPDHHGIINLAGLGLVLGLVLAGGGWIGGSRILPSDAQQARRGVIFSALFGAAGLWISAVSQTLMLVALGAGLLVCAVLIGLGKAAEAGGEGGAAAQPSYQPGLLRLWGRVGAAGSLAFWLLEFFPDALAMRLEVNHPLYALAWWGGAEVLDYVCEWLARQGWRETPFAWGRIVLPGLALAAFPAALLIGGAKWYVPADAFVLQVHRHIQEFLPGLERLTIDGTPFLVHTPYPLILVAAGLVAFRRRTPAAARGVLMLVAVYGLILYGMSWYQFRWGLLGGPSYVLLGALLAAVVLAEPAANEQEQQKRGLALALWPLGTALFCLCQSAACGWIPWISTEILKQDELVALLHWDLGRAIRERAGDGRVTLLSSPNTSLLTGCASGFHTIGTLYWENAPGLKAAADLYSNPDGNAVLAGLKARGITHLAFLDYEPFVDEYMHLAHPRPTPEQKERAFAVRVAEKHQLPTWLRPIPYATNSLTSRLKSRVLLLEFVPNQTEDEASLHVGLWLASQGEINQAMGLLGALAQSGTVTNEARFRLGLLQLRAGQTAEGEANVTQALAGWPPERKAAAELEAAKEFNRLGFQKMFNQQASLHQRAAALYGAVLAREPQNATAALWLAGLRLQSPDPRVFNAAEGLALFARLHEQAGLQRSPLVQFGYALALKANGRNAEAVEALRLAAEYADANAFALPLPTNNQGGSP